jgi:hypothetical protein
VVAADETETYARSLTVEDRTFLAVRDELYGGSWAEVQADLEARLAGKPYIFKLAATIKEDLERIARLRKFEEERGVNLGEVLKGLGLAL